MHPRSGLLRGLGCGRAAGLLARPRRPLCARDAHGDTVRLSVAGVKGCNFRYGSRELTRIEGSRIMADVDNETIIKAAVIQAAVATMMPGGGHDAADLVRHAQRLLEEMEKQRYYPSG